MSSTTEASSTIEAAPIATAARREVETVAEQLAAKEWSATSLGPHDQWPVSLRTLLATMMACPTPMFLAWGPDLLSFYNDAYVPILGYRAGFALGMPFRELWASIWDDISPLVDEAMAGGQTKVVDMRLDLSRTGEPEESYWTFTYSPAFDDDGRIAGMICVTGETTARVLAQRARAVADERLELALAAGNSIGIWDWDVVEDRVRADTRFAELYGVDPVLADRGAPIAEFFGGIHPDDLSRVREEIDEAMRGGATFQSEYRLRGSDGSVRWVAAQGSCILNEAGTCVRFPGVSFDITERVLAELKLRESEAHARADAERVQLAMAAGAIIGTWVWDLPNDCFTVDEPFAKAFGLDPALGREGLSLVQVVATVHPDDQVGLAAAIDAAIGRGGPYAYQYRVRRADGNYYWIEANGRVELGEDRTPLRFPGVLIDVEARREVEAERDKALADLRVLNDELEERVAERTAELMRAEEALRQAQKMEAVGQLTGGLAHDFNNLLTGMMGNLELLQQRIARGRLDDVDRFVLAAQGAGRRAAALTQRLLAFSRRQTLDPRPTDVNRLIAGMEDMIRRTIGPEKTLEVVGAGGLWTADIDAGQLENALLNLCINARDAMPGGGRLTIETANRWLDERSARERDLGAGQYLSICVTDTGTGMDQQTIDRAFEPFFTTKPIGQGTGLGLSMIYGFARQSGGQVRIYSELGQGTTMCIYLPRHVGDAQEEVAAAAPVDSGQAGSGTVLIVDDEITIRHLVDEVLDGRGYTVIGAADGAAALKVLQSVAPIDLLITDVGLPNGLNGRQVADAARELRQGLNVLFITGYAENAAIGNGHLDPGMALLTKPFSIDALAAKVDQMMREASVEG